MIRILIATLALLAALPAAAQGLQLFDDEDFGGRSVGLDVALPDLNTLRFRDRAASLVVGSGRWEVCSEPDHRGSCVVFTPGRWERLPQALSRRIASARPVQVLAAAGLPPEAGFPPPPGRPPGLFGASITLYQDAGQAGRSVTLAGASPRLSDQGFNDMASSIEVRRGRWELCAHADYGPPCAVFGPGRHGLEGALHDGLSSLRPLYGPRDEPLPRGGGAVLYENSGFDGREVLVTGPTPSLRALGFNDRASAIEVLAGRWRLCVDADYGGGCSVFGPGRHVLGGALHDGVSSLRPE